MNISDKRYITLVVSMFLIFLFSNNALFHADFSKQMSPSNVYSHVKRAFDKERGAFLVDEHVESYQSDGNIIAYVKSANPTVINLYDIETDAITEISSIPGNKSITNFCRDVLVFDVRIEPTNTDVYVYNISTETIKPISTEEGIQKGGATNGKYVVWWNANESGNLWAYKLDDDTQFKVTENNFPNYNDWYIENCDDYSLRNDLLDYKISKADFLLYETTMSTDTILECSRKKIVSYDLQKKTKHILTQGTENDFGFYGAIYEDTVLYSCAEIIDKQDPKHFQYTIYRYYPLLKLERDVNTNEKLHLYTKNNKTNQKPKRYYMPSFFKDDFNHYCSFAGQVFDLDQELKVYSGSGSGYDRTCFLGDSQIIVGINNPGKYQTNHNIIAYEIETKQKTQITPDNNQNGEKHLSFKKHIISWIASNYHNRLYIRSSPDVTINTEKNRVGLRQNSNTTFSISFHSNLGYTTTAGLSYSFPDNPEGLTCSFNLASVQLDGINDVNITITINSTASTPKGTYPLELSVQGSTFLLPNKMTIMVDVADFTIRSEVIEGDCYYSMPKTIKFYVKNLLRIEQTYHVEILSDYTEGEGQLVPYYMEYSVNKNFIVVPANDELYVEFTILMKSNLHYINYDFTCKVTNTADQSILNQEVSLILSPGFWIESDRSLLREPSGSTFTYYLQITANTNYTGTVHLDLDKNTYNYSRDYYSFSQNDFTLLPNEIRFVSLEVQIKDVCQDDWIRFSVHVNDLNSPDFNYTVLEFLVEPSFSVSIDRLCDLPLPINTVGQWRISVTSFHANRTIVLSRNPSFYPDKNTEFNFEPTILVFLNSGTQQAILSITHLSEDYRSFPLLVTDSLTGECFWEMIST